MAERNWNITVNGLSHSIRLIHGVYSGKRELWLDGALVEKGQKTLDSGSSHSLNIEGQSIEVLVATNSLVFRYFLLRDRIPLPSEEDKRKGITTEELLRSNYLGNLALWQTLKQTFGLTYQPIRGNPLAVSHRLVGVWNGYMVMIAKALAPPGGWLVIIRHGDALDPEAGKQLQANERLKTLLGKNRKYQTALTINPGTVGIQLPFIKNETVGETTARVREFFSIAMGFMPPLPAGRCEGVACQQKFTTQRHIVLINGLPWLLCQPCIDALPQQTQAAQQQYDDRPDHLLLGLTVGLGIALLGAVVWAAVVLLAGIIAAVVSYGVINYILRMMNKVDVKISWRSLALALGLTILSAICGIWLTHILFELRMGTLFSWRTIAEEWVTTWAKSNQIFGSILFALVGAVPALWMVWRQNKQEYAQVFHPQVEEVPGGYE